MITLFVSVGYSMSRTITKSVKRKHVRLQQRHRSMNPPRKLLVLRHAVQVFVNEGCPIIVKWSGWERKHNNTIDDSIVTLRQSSTFFPFAWLVMAFGHCRKTTERSVVANLKGGRQRMPKLMSIHYLDVNIIIQMVDGVIGTRRFPVLSLLLSVWSIVDGSICRKTSVCRGSSSGYVLYSGGVVRIVDAGNRRDWLPLLMMKNVVFPTVLKCFHISLWRRNLRKMQYRFTRAWPGWFRVSARTPTHTNAHTNCKTRVRHKTTIAHMLFTHISR
jgi:hypothetical protein